MAGNSFQRHFLTFVGLVCSVLFMASTMILLVGMLPTVAANLVDKSRQKSRAICVGMMNFVGCMPFLMELWMGPAPNSLDSATMIVLQPKTVIIMYFFAGAGYAIEATITGMISAMMLQRAQARIKQIDKQLVYLQDRWEDYVDGSVSLDDFGFPEHKYD